MAEPIFVKCEPDWPTCEGESSSLLPSEIVEVKLEPASSDVVKEEHSIQTTNVFEDTSDVYSCAFNGTPSHDGSVNLSSKCGAEDLGLEKTKLAIVHKPESSSDNVVDPETAGGTSGDDQDYMSCSETSQMIPTDVQSPEHTENESGDGYLSQLTQRATNGEKPNSKKAKNHKLRMEGKAYLGYRRTLEGRVVQDVVREERKQGAACTSKLCERSKFRECNMIKESARKEIFNEFWNSMSWDQRRVYVAGLVDLIPRKRPSTVESRRKGTFVYYLQVNRERKQVCKKMFLNTLGIKEWTVRYWKCSSSECGVNPVSANNHPQGNRKYIIEEFLKTIPQYYRAPANNFMCIDPSLWTRQGGM